MLLMLWFVVSSFIRPFLKVQFLQNDVYTKLFTPSAKYRTSRLKILGDVDFDQFVGDRKAEIKATGEEIVDMFDVDLSFG
jgi:uncharacterized membrane protein YjgN (DUF898 family)